MKKLITDKTLTAFEKWYYETHCKSSIKFEDLLLWQKAEVFDWLYSQCETIQYAFAVEFFDSVGIYVNVGGVLVDIIPCFGYDVQQNNTLNGMDEYNIVSRLEATTKALEKSNEIFNNR